MQQLKVEFWSRPVHVSQQNQNEFIYSVSRTTVAFNALERFFKAEGYGCFKQISDHQVS
jgi:hypothetical protein